MALVTGPLHSDAASGGFAGSMVFSTWKGRKYVRSLVIPSNPKTAKQVGIRSMMRMLSQAWNALATLTKATWQDLADTRNISTFNAFMAHNMERWVNWQAPTQDNPAAETSAAQTITTQTCTGGVGQVNISLAWTTNADDWAVAILRDKAAITVPDWTMCIAVVPPTAAGVLTYVDSPLVAGTYHYRTVILNNDGKMGTVKADSTGVAT